MPVPPEERIGAALADQCIVVVATVEVVVAVVGTCEVGHVAIAEQGVSPGAADQRVVASSTVQVVVAVLAVEVVVALEA